MSDEHIHSFNSFEEAQDFLRRAEDAANETVTEEQTLVSYGDTWVRFYDVANRIVIFGKVMTLEEIRREEAQLGAPDGEVGYTVRHVESMETRNYLWSNCFSAIEKRGEVGNIHRADLWPCPEDLWDAARLCAWEIDHLSPRHKAQLEQLYKAWRVKYLRRP